MHDLYRKLQAWVAFATNPHPDIGTERLQHNARLLASITLALIPLHILVAIVLTTVYGPDIWSWRFVLWAGAATTIVYFLSRSRYIITAVNIFIAELSILALALLYVGADSYSAVTALLPIYVASMFRSLTRLVITAILTIGGVFAISRLIPGDWTHLYGVLTLLIVTSIMIVIRSYFQWEAESQLRLRNQQLAESEARFRAAIDASIGMFFLLKAVRGENGQIQDFILVDVNSQAMKRFQRDYAALMSQPVSAVFPSIYQEELFTQCKRVVDTGTPVIKEIRSENTWWEYQAVPIGDGAAVIGFDITARKEAEKRRVELQIERERVTILQRFIRDISHDLMTPLSIISTSTYLAGKLETQEQRDLHLQKINEQTSRLKSIFENMIVQSRLDNMNREDLDCKPVDVNHLLQHLVASFGSAAQSKSQQLIFEPSAQPALSSIDKVSMEMALSHIIDNGLKYTPEGGVIGVSCERRDENIVIIVEDNGPGIPASDLPAIFERFYRAETHRPLTAGAGLGLPIAKKIIELHGGSISAENRAEGGMRFYVVLRGASG
jgi:signal transduction histidine kinase